MKENNKMDPAHFASAKAQNLAISTKHCVEISHYLRYKTTSFAKKFLERVINMEEAVPFRRFKRDTGHKPGMAAGRYPQKAAKEFLRLVKAVEANAQVKGLNVSTLKIIQLIANKASTPLTGGRHRQGTKRSHIEIMVKELGGKKKAAEKKVNSETKETPKVEEKKVEPKPVMEEKKVEETPKVEEVKEEPKVEEAPELQKEVKPEEKQKEEKVEPIPVEEPKQDLPKQETVETPIEKEQKPQKEIKEELEKIPKEKPEIKEIPIKEDSPEELLKKAQAKADQINKKEQNKEETGKVENLFEELKQKGTLRKEKK